jgi:hypothetical protein
MTLGNTLKKSFLLFITIIFFFACEKEEEKQENQDNTNHPNMVYVGDWNFKGNEYSYSGYYTYDSLMNSEWVIDDEMITNYNDSTGSIQLGVNDNELIFKYCESCNPVIYNLNDSGFVYSPNLGGETGWVLTDTTFFHIVIPSPPGYSTSYTTVDIEGWKLQ